MEEMKLKMQGVVERFKNELSKLRTGRAHPDMLAGVKVEAYGQFMPLNQVANVVVADATLLNITPFDPSTIQAIATAIRNDQSLGLNPADDGRVVRVPIPALTEERRREIVKTASGKAEEAKIALRAAREDARKLVKKMKDEKTASEDDAKRMEKQIDDTTQEFTSKIEAELKAKEAELMKI
ncbi:MAG: ribosome recycling factor [Candidatus Nomurabacteria bacterium]|jgi:ribosome recycling factor|nr:ribosome recycling factor [Candidatus Nomurabacteria bacterium]